MSLDHVQDQPAEQLGPATARVALFTEIVAFKFGGSSLLGAERMLHAASLVREASQSSRVVAIVSAMKGMTDQLLGISQSLAAGKRELARRQADFMIDLHLDVVTCLQLDEPDAVRIARGLQSLGRDLLHEIA
jgi:aspartokinase